MLYLQTLVCSFVLLMLVMRVTASAGEKTCGDYVWPYFPPECLQRGEIMPDASSRFAIANPDPPPPRRRGHLRQLLRRAIDTPLPGAIGPAHGATVPPGLARESHEAGTLPPAFNTGSAAQPVDG